ncbi:patatin-like phospholipase/acyl hydrolase [Planomicrobium sp. HSC-17F08]|uniref:Patatin n=1 Tax=Planococcus glaciei TaxID=459472 RepID=A0A7H8Q6L9_9BACL|nr:patatin-like phospholipase family protein [Planococcus glaciei]MCP2033622.1 patatin-like phospholipase/acyl hydrolase [Planomicrobium sp. HSC-17F08]QDY44850.1 patatin [Planococcus glaciei]QKX49567.1 patatin [Planococcus glaciei]
MIKILAIDGGGVRGIIPAIVLVEIEKRTGKPICELFDLISGTSAGGILALGLVVPEQHKADNLVPRYTAKRLAELIKKDAHIIFDKSILYRIPGGRYVYRRYPDDGIEFVLEKYFRDAMISDALTDVLIPAYEIEKRNPEFFKSAKVTSEHPTQIDVLMKDVARATSAAPTYFTPEKIETLPDMAFIDGGVYANNPAMCAYAEARAIFQEETDFLVVSLGTGEANAPIPYEEAVNWGHIGWSRRMLNIMMDGNSDSVDYQLRQIVMPRNGEARYYRFQAELGRDTEHIDNSDAFNMEKLEALGIGIIRDKANQAKLDKLCEQLMR